jgi:glutathione peroxidase
MAKLGRRLFAGFAFVAGMAGYYGWRLIGQVDAAQLSAGGPRTAMRAWDIDFVSIEGDALPLKNFQGKALLIVNTASLCGFTPQYKELEKVWDDYKDKGLVVIGVPSNDFGGQEPGSAAEIKAFCESYDVSFPIADKAATKGAARHPFFGWVAAELGEGALPRWNFFKYLVGRDGTLRGAWPSTASPSGGEIRAAIEKALTAGV